MRLRDAMWRGLGTGYFFGLLLGLQEGLAAASITRFRTGDASITALSKLVRVFFTPVLADSLAMALLAVIPALVLWAWKQRSRSTPAVEDQGFNAMLAGLTGGLTVLIYTMFSTFKGFSPAIMFKPGNLTETARIVIMAIVAGLAIQVLMKRFSGRRLIRAITLVLVGLLLPTIPLALWAGHNPNHPLGGRPGQLLVSGCTALLLILTTLILRQALLPRASLRQMYRWWIGLTATLLLAGTFIPLAATADHQDSAETLRVPGDRNVVLFTVDTLRADALDLDNPERSRTPNAARLAHAGTRFDNTQAQSPWTLPSLCSLMTSIHPTGQGVVNQRNRLDGARQTLADTLAATGYLTQAVVCNAWLTDRYGLQQGFQNYKHVWVEEASSEYWQKMIWIRVFRRFRPAYLRAPNSHDSKEMVDRAITFLEKNAGSNFFLWVHVIDPHDPYAPLGRFRQLAGKGYRGKLSPKRSGIINTLRRGRRLEAEDRQHLQNLYDLEVQYADEQFGRLLDTLERLGLWDKTLVAFTSDHGEEFWEHENMGHGHTLHNELTHVPLIIKLPGETPAVQQVESQVRLIDVVPTIVDILDLPPLAEAQGESMLPLMRGEPRTHRPSFSEALMYFGEKKSVDDGRYRLILSPNSGREELYDLETDPGARRNLIEALPEVALRLKQSLNDHLREQVAFNESLQKSEEGGEVVLDARTKERLRSLGYLQ